MGQTLTPFATAVRASAGSGKTRLLTLRIVRLLLEGADPGSVIAITFTHKAADEIRARVLETLADLAEQSANGLIARLTELGCDTGPATCERAAALYETVLTADYPLQTTTFHAFCQRLLSRFALEADIAPEFELIEHTYELERAAWKMFEARAGTDPDLGQALDRLFESCDGLSNTLAALQAFLDHRSDWWAYIEGETDPAAAAGHRLTQQLSLYLKPPLTLSTAALREYADLITRHDIAFHRDAVAAIQARVGAPLTEDDTLDRIFLKADLSVRDLSKPLLRVLSPAEATRLQTLHAALAETVRAQHVHRLAQATLVRAQDWYKAGMQLLDCYTALKRERNVLDFADLEWHAYRLLSHSEHAEWVQYKLDRRLQHILVDEFQDTNPTQWRLLVPLLEAIAADPRGNRSVLLVGDEKQSIYRFRRAQPALFDSARNWLAQRGPLEDVVQTTCWRSSPAIVEFVNRVFTTAELPGFPHHSPGHRQRWGEVNIWPLIVGDEPASNIALRDPLQAPRAVAEDRRYRRDAERVAAEIARSVNSRVVDTTPPRRLQYRDVMILMRERTHAAHYEDAFRRYGIPYLEVAQIPLRACLEVADIRQLLCWLQNPTDNLALASVLRAPLFACSDEDLVQLAQHARTNPHGDWWEALKTLPAPSSTLVRAQQLLPTWLAAADTVPVHDLLDRIYHDGNVAARYQQATPTHLRVRVAANLARLLSLALEIDAGRYSRISRFIEYLDTIDNTVANEANDADCVRLMTIHGAKGLEAPMVFLIDAARAPQRDSGIRALIDWPAEAARPSHFYLVGKADTLDPYSAALVQKQRTDEQREDFNLLYVALTRAKQWLYITGCAPKRETQSWYSFLTTRLGCAEAEANGDAPLFSLRHGTAPEPALASAVEIPPIAIDPRLTQPLPIFSRDLSPIRPSGSGTTEMSEPRARRRGTAIHRALQLLSTGHAVTKVRDNLTHEFFDLDATTLDSVVLEAEAVIRHPDLRDWYEPEHYRSAENELPIAFVDGESLVSGTIDRAIFFENEIILIEYKTQAATDTRLSELVARYSDQLRLYVRGVRQLWPNHRVGAALLFTANRRRVDVPI